MEKQEWQSIYDILKGIYNRFLEDYYEYEHGRNKKIRAAALNNACSGIMLACHHIEKNFEIYKLLTGGDGRDDYSRTLSYDEFKLPRYFKNDMKDLLHKIKRETEKGD
jgi:hypothetical protein